MCIRGKCISVSVFTRNTLRHLPSTPRPFPQCPQIVSLHHFHQIHHCLRHCRVLLPGNSGVGAGGARREGRGGEAGRNGLGGYRWVTDEASSLFLGSLILRRICVCVCVCVYVCVCVCVCMKERERVCVCVWCV